MEIKEQLGEEIQSQFKDLKQIQLGTEEYKNTVDGLTKLVDRAIEIEKFEMTQESEIEKREIDNNLKLMQMENDKKDNRIRNGIAIAGIVVPVGVTIWGTLKSFKFEETGTITTVLGRGFLNKLLPKK